MSLRLDLTTKLTEVSRKEGKKNSSVKKGRPKFLMSYWEPDFYSVLYKEFFHFSMVAMLCGGALPQQKYRRFLFGHYCIFDSSSEWSYHISLNNQYYLERRFTKKHKVGYMQVQNT